ncbi:MAG TPA: YpdA family putative bacillithiol disulfide reductase [Trueperaceae bacterium]|nr:YpdA family putative bacillithiol disulfide reductase [Trueperaceae bacterium]
MAAATPTNSAPASATKVDVAIIGAGPIGLECAILAKRAGLGHIVLDKGPITAAIARYPTYMTFFTTSERLEVGGHPLVTATDKPTRKEALDYYRKVVANDELNVRTYSRVLAIKRVAANKEGFEVAVEAAGASGFSGTVSAEVVMVATGYFDNPNPLGVPGEHLDHVSHYYTEAHPFFGRPVTLVGGGSSAADAALDLYRAGAKVTMVHRGEDFKPSLKYWIRPNLLNRIKEGSITALLNSRLKAIEQDHVVVRTPTGEQRLRSDQVFALTGYFAPPELLLAAGVRVDLESCVAELDPETRESNVPGLYVVGSAGSGRRTSDVFIENGLVHAAAAMQAAVKRLAGGKRDLATA